MEDAGGRQGGTDAKRRISEKESVTAAAAAAAAASVKNGGFIPELKAPDREPTRLKKIDLCVRILAGKYQTCQTVLEFRFRCLRFILPGQLSSHLLLRAVAVHRGNPD